MNRASLAPWLALGVVVVAALAWATWPTDSEPAARERTRALTAELRCPDCEGLAVADSPTTTARAIRSDIARRVAAGESDEQIRQAYVDRYGESILLKPEGGGLGFLVWGLPVVVLVLGAAAVALVVGRGRRDPRLHPTAADEALVERARDG